MSDQRLFTVWRIRGPDGFDEFVARQAEPTDGAYQTGRQRIVNRILAPSAARAVQILVPRHKFNPRPVVWH